VRFNLPVGQKESRILRDGRGTLINWNLVVTLATPGVDYRATFQVPVYRRLGVRNGAP
jgi:hypothetical protein